MGQEVRRNEDLYKSQVVCRACKITPRRLGYWLERGVVEATKVATGETKPTFFFDYAALQRVYVVARLREAGVPLQRIATAVAELRGRGRVPDLAWLVSAGSSPYVLTKDPRLVESLSKGERGQLVFSVLALGPLPGALRIALKRCEAVDPTRWATTKGRLVSWARRIRR